jgi:hypothetical protein
MKIKILLACLAGLVLGGFSTWYYVDHRIRSGVDDRLQAAVDDGNYAALHYESLSYNYKGDIRIYNLHVEQPGFKYVLEVVELTNLDFSNDPPRTVDVRIQGLKFPDGVPDLSDSDNPTLGRLLERVARNDAIPLELNYSHRYDPDNAWQVDSVLKLDIPGLLLFDLNGTMRNLPLEELQQEPALDPLTQQAQYQPLLNRTELPSLQLSLQDLGLVRTMLEIGAQDFNVSAEDYQTLVTSQLRNAWLFMPQQTQELIMEAGSQLADFLDGGRTLTLSMQPEHNGSIEMLQPLVIGAVFTGNFNQVVELLNLEFSTR